MKHQPSTLVRNVSIMQRDTINIQDNISGQDAQSIGVQNKASCLYFRRSALFTALATSLVGFGIAPSALADTENNVATPNQTVTNQAASEAELPLENDAQLDMALDALRLKKAVEQGIIDQSVLDDYSEQTLGIKKAESDETDLNNNTRKSENPSQDMVGTRRKYC